MYKLYNDYDNGRMQGYKYFAKIAQSNVDVFKFNQKGMNDLNNVHNFQVINGL